MIIIKITIMLRTIFTVKHAISPVIPAPGIRVTNFVIYSLVIREVQMLFTIKCSIFQTNIIPVIQILLFFEFINNPWAYFSVRPSYSGRSEKLTAVQAQIGIHIKVTVTGRCLIHIGILNFKNRLDVILRIAPEIIGIIGREIIIAPATAFD